MHRHEHDPEDTFETPRQGLPKVETISNRKPDAIDTKLGAGSGKNQTDGKGLIAHGSGSRTCMGERINSVHGSLIPCHVFIKKEIKVRESVQIFTNNYCSLAISCPLKTIRIKT